jgi:hypothetical protein
MATKDILFNSDWESDSDQGWPRHQVGAGEEKGRVISSSIRGAQWAGAATDTEKPYLEGNHWLNARHHLGNQYNAGHERYSTKLLRHVSSLC